MTEVSQDFVWCVKITSNGLDKVLTGSVTNNIEIAMRNAQRLVKEYRSAGYDMDVLRMRLVRARIEDETLIPLPPQPRSLEDLREDV